VFILNAKKECINNVPLFDLLFCSFVLIKTLYSLFMLIFQISKNYRKNQKSQKIIANELRKYRIKKFQLS